jgi:ATP-dependent RNA helicase SUPV3L1/SUV3
MDTQPHFRITAVLGPTNTGKTHLAVERMLGYRTGAIGLPLRLLAREIYDKVVIAKGENATALITGEEKIVPKDAKYFVCTVESMPISRGFEFLAVDEVQLAADPERGHVFTDRLLYARGTEETMFLGSDAIRPILRRLVPEAEFISRPRLSNLKFSGHKKLSRLPSRSAVVSFTAQGVYGLADSLRRHRGGAAVVLGALSPRTRNAQVAMFENGEVDYMVATDAVGMGLNLNVDHLAFAARAKFDGFVQRELLAHEVAQIAGRAGRYLRDGTFGATLDCAEFDPQMVENVEGHRFKDISAVHWRNADLDFSSGPALVKSLQQPPPERWRKFLTRPKRAVDQEAFAALSTSRAVYGAQSVRLLWEVCQIPDFRKTMVEAHTKILGRIFGFLSGSDGEIPTDWMASQIARLDRVDGDIDMLAARIAHVRTWTYICHRDEWVPDPVHWKHRARAVEDRLSDALHDRLTQRFVDRRVTVLLRALSTSGGGLETISNNGLVLIDGEAIGHLEGFKFVPDTNLDATHGDTKLVKTAAQRTLRSGISTRAKQLRSDQESAFSLDPAANILWQGYPVAKLRPGRSVTTPQLALSHSELLDGAAKASVTEHLEFWLAAQLSRAFSPLKALQTEGLTGAARGLAFQVAEGLGSVSRVNVADQVAVLTPLERKALRSRGISFAAQTIFLPRMTRPGRAALACQMWALYHRLDPLPPSPMPGLVSVEVADGVPAGFYAAAGYRVIGDRAVRVDMLERLDMAVRSLSKKTRIVEATPKLRAIVGCQPEPFEAVMKTIGYARADPLKETEFLRIPRATLRRRPHNQSPRPQNSAFSALAAHPALSRQGR